VEGNGREVTAGEGGDAREGKGKGRVRCGARRPAGTRGPAGPALAKDGPECYPSICSVVDQLGMVHDPSHTEGQLDIYQGQFWSCA